MNLFDELFDIDNILENDLIDILKKCDNEYFNNDSFYVLNENDTDILNKIDIHYDGEVDDEKYNDIYFKVKSLYSNNNYFNNIGSIVKSGKIKLDIPMGSANELKKGDWDKWKINCDYVISNKLDGCSCRLYYENGQLIKAMSRGNGYEGQDITRHIIKLKNIKMSLPENINIKIRGEIITPKKDIDDMLKNIEIETGKTPKNQRNSISGFINSKNGIKAVADKALFIAYKIEEWKSTEFEMFDYLRNHLKIDTADYELINNNTSEEQLVDKLKEIKNNYDFECDGLIITQNITQPGYEGYETNSIKRKSSRKFKVGTGQLNATTEVVDVIWNVSKDGLFKPKVRIKPVQLVGVTIEYATGNNYKNIIDNKIGKGSIIQICRSGDVIPFIQKVIKPCTDDLSNYNLPNSNLWKVESVDIKLNNNFEFDDETYNFYKGEQIIQKLIYFCNCLSVEQAGEGNIRKILLQKNILEYNIKNLILESKETFINNIGINGNVFFESLHQKLKESNECKFFDAVGCFGRGIGETKLNKVYNKYHTLNVSMRQLLDIEGFANKSSEQYFEHLNNYFDWVDWLKDNNIELSKPKIYNGKYNNIVVCFTGVRDSLMEQNIKMNGGKIVSSVTKICNLLICDSLNSNSGKMNKAKEKGIEIIDYEDACRRFY